MKITALLFIVIATATASAQVMFKSYADVYTIPESCLSSLSSIRRVENTAAASVPAGSGGFATEVIFPEGTTSAVFTTASYTRVSKTNGGSEVTAAPGVVSMSASKFNPEGDVSTPSLFYRNSDNNVIVPVNSNFVGTTLTNPRKVLITEQRAATLPQLVQTGDYWEFRRTLSGTYVLEGSTIPFSVVDSSAKVLVVNETDAPITTVSPNYTTDVKMGQPMINSENVVIIATGENLTPSSYNVSWWIETSVDLVNWSTTTNATVSPGSDVILTFPYNNAKSKRFWRIKTLLP